MCKNNSKKITLLPHNIVPYQRIIESLRNNSRCYIEHPTGAGKSYIIGHYIQEHVDTQTLFLTNSSALVRDFEDKIRSNLPFKERVQTATYSKIPLNMRNLDTIILDELHSCGAFKAEKNIRKLLDTNPQAKVIGVSATVIRFLDKKRNMGIQLCHGNLASRYDLTDAFRDHAVEEPFYTKCYAKGILDFLKECGCDFPSDAVSRDSFQFSPQQIENLNIVFKNTLRYWTGKYIVFVPNLSFLIQAVERCTQWFSFVPGEIACYWEYYKESRNKNNYEQFKNDNSDRLRLFFCIEKFTHGVHPDIDGVILMRKTDSLNLFSQMIGRCMKNNPKRRPQVLDIVNNIDHFAKKLSFPTEPNSLLLRPYDAETQIEEDTTTCELTYEQVELHDFYLTMKVILRTQISWRDAYTLAEHYSRCHGGKLDCPLNYVTPEGFPLGEWVAEQRVNYHTDSRNHLSPQQIALLEKIGIDWGFPDQDHWMQMYDKAVAIYGSRSNGIPAVGGKNEPVEEWLDAQFMRLAGLIKPPLVDEQIRLLQDLYYDWEDTSTGKWKKNIDIIRERYFHNGVVRIPSVKDNIHYQWWQRQLIIFYDDDKKYTLLPWQRNIMTELGANQTLHVSFQENLQRCRLFLQEHETIQELFQYRKDPAYKHLISWLRYLQDKEAKGNLRQAEKDALETSGIDLSKLQMRSRFSHDKIYHALVKYYALFGSINVPRNYILNGVPLYKCLYSIKKSQGRTLCPEMKKKYAQMGLIFDEVPPSKTS